MQKQHILFDLDDTLVHCNKYFYEVIDRFTEQMMAWFSAYALTPTAIQQKQLEFDLAGVHAHGFLKERFPESLVETYEYFIQTTGRKRSLEEIDVLLSLGYSVYEREVEAYPHMEETLTVLLEEGHELSLYTGGDAGVQRMKVKQLGLDRIFGDRIFVSLYKTTEVLNQIISELGLDRSRTWMVGNSARTDVIPALEAGINSIFIPVENDWEFNQVDIRVAPKGAFMTLRSLEEVPDAIERYIQYQASRARA